MKEAVIKDLKTLEPEEAGLLGTIWIYGVPHHIHFIEVRVVDDMQEPVKDPYGRYEDMQRAYDGYYTPVKVPGYTGDYVVMVLPYAD